MNSIGIKTLAEYLDSLRQTGTVIRLWIKGVNDDDTALFVKIHKVITDSVGNVIGIMYYCCDDSYVSYQKWDKIYAFAISDTDQEGCRESET